MPRIPFAVLAAGALLAVAGGCGGNSGGERPESAASLLLDFQPNAVHAGIYTAVARGFDSAEGVELEVRAPAEASDSIKLLTAGRVDFAILDIHDLALARERGRDLVGVMAVVQRPLAALLAAPDVSSPRELEGRRVGVTGLPSDEAVLASIVRGDGGDPDRVRRVTIGFNAVPSLLSGRVAAATAFWNAEGVALERERPGMREFRVDDYGAPAYPELVLATTRTLLDEQPAVARALVAALVRGYKAAIKDPESRTSDLVAAVPGLEGAPSPTSSRPSARRSRRAPDFGRLDRARLVAGRNGSSGSA